ncbi:DUF4258 domain-containing protein [Tropicimonas sp. IMCC6043]|uniref:DUF4258 domain-containing protein n=1 Tax=Tropicimonas sp. IMCC6043 TaxID=2510645 RepID=UPI00101D3311|nr:DUF4258 domain-containing protein [Tropicimonas sp. IMCC6043]RYH06526.1 DUF4258 domain-containing protein [Tropicimonas sp. IMCC6043]
MSDRFALDTFTFSDHATTRMAQRGIQEQFLEILLMYGSRTDAGGGCEQYRLLDKTARELKKRGHESRPLEAAARIRAIIAPGGIVVTCFHRDREEGRRSRRRPRRSSRRKEHGWFRAREV